MEMSFSIVRCGDVHLTLWLHTPQDPPANEWTAAIEQITELKRKLGGVSNIRTLAVTDGGAPNATQRGELFTDLLEGQARSAAVSTVLSNRLKRGIATAVFWLNPNFKAFPPEEFRRALDHLGLEGEASKILTALQELQKSIPTNKTLEAILKAAQG